MASLKEMARRLGVSRPTAQQWVASGAVAGAEKTRRGWQIPEATVRELAASAAARDAVAAVAWSRRRAVNQTGRAPAAPPAPPTASLPSVPNLPEPVTSSIRNRPAACTVRPGHRGVMYDSASNRYEYVTDELPVSRLVVHDQPGEFQSRDLTLPHEQLKIDRISRRLDLERLSQMGPCPSEGAITVWPDDANRPLVIAGNGRALAARRAGVDELPVRVLDGNREDARRLAALSQESAAGAQGMLGEARAVVRAAGIEPGEAPPNVPRRPVTPRTVGQFISSNPQFSKRLSLPEEKAAAADRLNLAMVGMLPESIQGLIAAFGSDEATERQARAESVIVASAPALLWLRAESAAGRIDDTHDILAHLERAAGALQQLARRKRSAAALVRELGDMAEQQTLPGAGVARVPLGRDEAAVIIGILGWVGRANPAEAAAADFVRFTDWAAGQRGGLFAEQDAAERLAWPRRLFGRRVEQLAERIAGKTDPSPAEPQESSESATASADDGRQEAGERRTPDLVRLVAEDRQTAYEAAGLAPAYASQLVKKKNRDEPHGPRTARDLELIRQAISSSAPESERDELRAYIKPAVVARQKGGSTFAPDLARVLIREAGAELARGGRLARANAAQLVGLADWFRNPGAPGASPRPKHKQSKQLPKFAYQADAWNLGRYHITARPDKRKPWESVGDVRKEGRRDWRYKAAGAATWSDAYKTRTDAVLAMWRARKG